MIRYFIPAILAGLIASAATAHADAIAGPTEIVTCIFNHGTSTVQHGTTDCSVTGAQATIATLPTTSLFATGGLGPNTLNSSQANASLTYFFEVLGGTQSEQIPILVTTDLSAAFTGNGGAGASITIDTVFDGAAKAVCANVTASSCPSTQPPAFDGTFSVTALDGVAAQVKLFATGGGGGVTGGSGTATADPLIQIDPAFLANNPGLTLEFSAGVRNGLPAPAGVPEPSTLTLLGAGLAALAGWRSCSRRTNPGTPDESSHGDRVPVAAQVGSAARGHPPMRDAFDRMAGLRLLPDHLIWRASLGAAG
jgi:hypothetical protein